MKPNLAKRPYTNLSFFKAGREFGSTAYTLRSPLALISLVEGYLKVEASPIVTSL